MIDKIYAGNDPELDPDREPEPPTKIIDKPTARTGKRNAGAEAPAPAPAAGATGGRPVGGGRGGRDQGAFAWTGGEEEGYTALDLDAQH